MSEINIRSDSVDVEQIMRQIRARIREKRGVDYTEEEIRELAAVKLEKFLDPRGVRSDCSSSFARVGRRCLPPQTMRSRIRRSSSHIGAVHAVAPQMLNPILKLFFNPNPLIQALHIQSELNTRNARREELDTLHYEMLHNLVLELTRLGIEVKNLKMRVESMSSRLDFDERRARALEGVVMYRPGAAPPLQPPSGGEQRPATTATGPSDHRNGAPAGVAAAAGVGPAIARVGPSHRTPAHRRRTTAAFSSPRPTMPNRRQRAHRLPPRLLNATRNPATRIRVTEEPRTSRETRGCRTALRR